MPLIYNTVKNYLPPYGSINTSSESTLDCRKIDLYRSMITVGNPSFLSYKTIKKFGFYRAIYNSLIEKVATVASNIESDRNGIRRHLIFDTYVSDKKRVVSYNLGMAFAKLYSEKILGIPNLVHLEFLKKSNAVTFLNNNSKKRPKEPDLVGQTPDGSWHIFEAKGISTSESQLKNKIIEAKKQINQVSAIHGNAPLTGSACATYIGRDRIFTHLEDPSTNELDTIVIDYNKFITSYYSIFFMMNEVLNQSKKRKTIDGIDVDFYDLEYDMKTLSNEEEHETENIINSFVTKKNLWKNYHKNKIKNKKIKLSIGLNREISECVRAKKYDRLNEVTLNLKKYSLSTHSKIKSNYSVGLDGFIVSYTNY
ncbi:hypothetical protein QDS07_000584 [Morganella morganii]|nr:hypothetical protein [Morganella morganii]